MKKVLIITYYWPPSGGSGVQRWLKFVKYLPQFGYQPVVYTVENGEYPSIDHTLEKEIPAGLTVIRKKIIEPFLWYRKFMGKKNSKVLPGFLDNGPKDFKSRLAIWIRSNLFIPDPRMLWIRPSVRFLSTYIRENNIENIITTGPPHSLHVIGLHLKKQLNITWIADFRDPWTGIDYFDKLDLTKSAREKHFRLEKSVLQHASAVITVGKTLKDELEELSGRKVEVVLNGYDEDDMPPVLAFTPDKFTISHFGVLGGSRDHQIFWKGLKELADEDENFAADLKIQIIGDINPGISESAKKFNLFNHTTFIPYLQHKDVIVEEQKSSLLYLSINKTQNAKGIITGKIFEYLCSGRPIICIGPEDGDAAEIVNGAEAGVVVGFDDLKKFKEAISNYYQAQKAGKLAVKTNNYVKYSRKSLTGTLAEILNSLNDRT